MILQNIHAAAIVVVGNVFRAIARTGAAAVCLRYCTGDLLQGPIWGRASSEMMSLGKRV